MTDKNTAADAARDIAKALEQEKERAERDELIRQFNEKYMVVCEAGKALIYAPRKDQRSGRTIYDRMTPRDLSLLYQNNPILLTDEDGTRKAHNRAKVWLSDRMRHQYIDGVEFDPSGTVGAGVLNLWKGFNVESKPGTWMLLKLHMLDVVCRGNVEHYEYLLSWLAYMVQHPNLQGEVAVVMRGPEGCGKGIAARAVNHIFGQHGLAISNAKHLIGNFNAHLRDCVFLFADEAFFAGDKAHVSVLKAIITEPTLTIEGKGQNVVQAPNCLHVMMASNETWVVPASIYARRFFVLDVSGERIGDYAYFDAIQQQLENGGYEAMLHELLHRDLTGFRVQRVPETEGLQAQKKLSLTTEASWWLDCLQRGYVYQSRYNHAWLGEWHDKMTTDLLFESYSRFADHTGERRPLAREAFGMLMSDMGYRGRRLTDEPIGEAAEALIRKARPPGYLLGTLQEARAKFISHSKLSIEWADDNALFDELEDEGFTYETAESGP
jgi:hypothetical protein